MEGGEIRVSSIDERVVQAKFDNAQFLQGVRSTLDGLNRLKQGLQLNGATKGLENVDAAAKRLSLDRIATGVDKISSRFNALTVVATAALSRITMQAVNAGERMLKALTLDPVKAGFENYETQINAIQTILANTGLKGSKGLAQVNAVLADMNEYANKTIYNFSEMARNIGTFTAAGVKLNVAKDSIKGIANLAALSGSNSQQASTAMYQLSQAIAANSVKLQDWNSVVNAGMGGKVFQTALFNTGKALHTIKGVDMSTTFDQWTKAGHTFRQSLKDGWVTGKVLTQTLQGFTGDLTAAQLKAMGYNAAQIKQIQAMGKTAVNAATQIKTASQMFQALKEEVATAWASVFKTLFGDINQARGLFTPLHNVLQNMLTGPIYAFNHVLEEWAKLGGRVKLIDAFKTGFQDLQKIMAPIKAGFREIFPATTGQALMNITTALDNFVHSFKMGVGTAGEIKKTFAGVFAVFDIIRQVIGGVVHGIGQLFGALASGGKSSGGLLALTSGIGDFLVGLDELLKKSGGVKTFFSVLAHVLAVPLRLLTALAGFIGKLFTGFDDHGASQMNNALDTMGKKLNPVVEVGKRVLHFFGKLGTLFKGVGHAIGDALSHIGDAISKSITPQTFEHALSVINTALLGGIVLLIRKFLKGGKLSVDLGGGLLGSFKETMKATTDTMKSLQTQIKADAIMKIAIAMGILSAAIYVLSTINGKKLAKAMTGVSVGIGGMSISLIALSKHIKLLGALKLPLIAVGLMGIATALLLYAGAMKILSTIPLEKMGIALGGAAAGLGIMAAAMQLMPKNPLIVAQGAALILFAAGLNVLALALKIFATMSWDKMAHGLAALAGSLAIIAGAVKLLPKTLALQAAGLTILAVALNGIAMAMKIFGSMDLKSTAKALIAMGGALAIIAGAIALMPPTMVLQAAGLLAVSVALNVIAGAMKILGTMSWTDIAQGMVALAGSLAILAGGLYLMTGALPGAAALLVASGALAIFTPVLVALGNLSWGNMVKGFVALAGSFAILGAAGLLLAPVTPVLLGLGAAMLLLGAGFALVGVGAVGVATAFAILVAAVTSGGSLIVQTAIDVAKSLPIIATGFAKALVATVVEIGKNAGKIVKAFGQILGYILDAIIKYTPKILDAIGHILSSFLDIIIKNAPKIGRAMGAIIHLILDTLDKNMPYIVSRGADIIVKLLNGLAKEMPRLVTAGTNVIIAFIKGIGSNAVRIAQAAMQTIVQFVNGLATAIEANVGPLRDAGGRLAFAIADGMTLGLAGKVKDVAGAAANLAKSALNSAKGFLGIHSPSKEFEKVGIFVGQGFKKGIDGSRDSVVKSWTSLHDLLKTAVDSSRDDIKKYSDRLNTLESAHKKNTKAIKETKAALVEARKEHAASSLALDNLNTKQKNHYATLQALGTRYEKLKDQIDSANQALKDSIQTRDDYAKQIKDQYSTLPSIGGDVTVALQDTADQITKTTVDQTKTTTALQSFTDQLQFQVNDTVKYAQVVQQLRDMGLNDQMYQKLLSDGPASLQFAEELLAGGATAVQNVDSLSDQLVTAAGNLGQKASINLYQAGVDAAQGLVNGLMSQQKAIEKQMDKIANDIVKTIKKKLHIKSPSRVMHGLGEFITQGLANGIEAFAPVVEKATAGLGGSVIDSLKTAISGINDAVSTNIDVNPTIAPVVDLSAVHKGAAQLDSILGKQFSVSGSYSAATDANAGYQANQQAAADAATPITPPVPGSVTFNQYNQSPKALSSADIYRMTKNQLSQAKGALTPSAA